LSGAEPRRKFAGHTLYVLQVRYEISGERGGDGNHNYVHLGNARKIYTGFQPPLSNNFGKFFRRDIVDVTFPGIHEIDAFGITLYSQDTKSYAGNFYGQRKTYVPQPHDPDDGISIVDLAKELFLRAVQILHGPSSRVKLE